MDAPVPPKKKCLRCEIAYPDTEEYFSLRKYPKTGLRGTCRCCYFNSRHMDLPRTPEAWIKALRMLIWRADVMKWPVKDAIQKVKDEVDRHNHLVGMMDMDELE